MPAEVAPALAAGARNLLEGCAELRPGQRLLVLAEDPALGWYDAEAPTAVATVAEEMGAHVTCIEVGGPDDQPPDLGDARAATDVEVCFARIGDQDRFAPRDPVRITVMCYARTAEVLASDFGTRPHQGMLALRDRVNTRLAEARHLRITCPSGSDLSGTPDAEGGGDVTIRRFPMCVPRPVSAEGFSGRIALVGGLYPTGSRSYQPACIAVSGRVFAHVRDGRIEGFEGPSADVARIEAHYAHVAGLFGIDPMVVHSWHAGIHAGCTAPTHEPDLWANTIFGSPRWLHLHTCGDYAPGEICWMVEAPTVMAEHGPIWRAGRLVP